MATKPDYEYVRVKVLTTELQQLGVELGEKKQVINAIRAKLRLAPIMREKKVFGLTELQLKTLGVKADKDGKYSRKDIVALLVAKARI
jgi:hypothetical protein